MWFFKYNKHKQIKNINTTTIMDFFNSLADIISTDNYNSSYKDFTFSNVLKNSDLYIVFSSNQNFIDNKLIYEFNLYYDKKYEIKEIKNIIISDVLIRTSERGCTTTNLYNISFTVYYNNLTV